MRHVIVSVLFLLSAALWFLPTAQAKKDDDETFITSGVVKGNIGPTGSVGCSVLNVTENKTVSGEIAIYSTGRLGTEYRGGAGFGPLDPLRLSGFGTGGAFPDPGGLQFFCRVKLSEGTKKNDVRAVFTIYDSNDNPLIIMPVE